MHVVPGGSAVVSTLVLVWTKDHAVFPPEMDSKQ